MSCYHILRKCWYIIVAYWQTKYNLYHKKDIISPYSKMSKKKSPFDPLRWCNICSFRADKAFKGFGCTSLGSHHTCWAFTNVHSSVLIQILIPTGALYVLMCHYWSSRQHSFWEFHSAHTRVTMVIANYSNTIYDAISGQQTIRLKFSENMTTYKAYHLPSPLQIYLPAPLQLHVCGTVLDGKTCIATTTLHRNKCCVSHL